MIAYMYTDEEMRGMVMKAVANMRKTASALYGNDMHKDMVRFFRRFSMCDNLEIDLNVLADIWLAVSRFWLMGKPATGFYCELDAWKRPAPDSWDKIDEDIYSELVTFWPHQNEEERPGFHQSIDSAYLWLMSDAGYVGRAIAEDPIPIWMHVRMALLGLLWSAWNFTKAYGRKKP